MLRTPQWMPALLITCVAMSTVGCKSKPKQAEMRLRVELAPTLKADSAKVPNVTVHLVGLTDSEVPAWSAMKVNDYLQPNNSLAKIKKSEERLNVVNLGKASEAQTIFYKSLSKRWKSEATHLAVFANWPRGGDVKVEQEDTRRRIVILDSRAWKGVKELVIQITDNGVTLSPGPKPIND